MTDKLRAEIEMLRKGWLNQAERDAREIVRLEVEIERLKHEVWRLTPQR